MHAESLNAQIRKILVYACTKLKSGQLLGETVRFYTVLYGPAIVGKNKTD